jgi:hypothetical protein
MILDTISFLLLTYISLCSFIGFGFLTNHILFKESISGNIFNYFFLGLVFIIPFSLIYYIIIGNHEIINLCILLSGFLIFLKKSKFIDVKFIFWLTTLFFIGLLISKSHEDFSVYHFQHIVELSDGNIKFGLSNLDERYFYSSIYSYVQTLFKLYLFEYNLINIPSYIIFLSLIGYLFKEIDRNNNNFINTFFLILIVFKFKRFSEFGYDYIGQFILIYLFSEFIYKNKLKSLISASKLILIYTTSVLIKITNVYFLPFLIFNFFFKKRGFNLLRILKAKIFWAPLLILIFTFTANSFLKTGCFNYLFKDTCIYVGKHSWVFDYNQIESSKKLTKNWSRGFYHQTKKQYKEKEYNKNFKWINNWLNGHFSIKILPFILLLAFILFILKFYIFKKKFFLENKDKLDLSASLIALLIWLINFPQYRFGFAVIVIFIFLIFESFINIPKKFEKKRLLSVLLIGIIFFNISNISRITSEIKRKDVYKYNNFPWFAKPPANFKNEISNNFNYLRSQKGEIFWRTCFDANLICVNHDHKIDLKKNKRFIYISKY